MDLHLEATSAAGAELVTLAQRHAAEAGERAAEHDRDGSFPFEAFDAMKASGFMRATLPCEFGGLGVDSASDVTAALERLGAGDGSIAIAANMHLAFGLVMGWLRQVASDSDDSQLADGLELLLGMLGGGTIAMANNTERGTDLGHPMLEATRVEGGWLLNGRKTFGTLSPIADLFLVTARARRDDGTPGAANAFVFRGAEGQEIRENWDAMGMRASGSHDVVYRDCFVPESLLFDGGDWGTMNALTLVIIISGNLGLLGCFLGIAEAARDQAVATARAVSKGPSKRPLAERPGIQHLVAEMDADLAVCRALLERTGRLVDRIVYDGPTAEATVGVLHELNHQFQCTKLVVNRAAIDVVDRALTVTGGAGYLSGSSLSRLYRDVRAGPFMQPYSPTEAHEYIGRVALGLDPDVSRG